MALFRVSPSRVWRACLFVGTLWLAAGAGVVPAAAQIVTATTGAINGIVTDKLEGSGAANGNDQLGRCVAPADSHHGVCILRIGGRVEG
jgi:hypothetical protein